ncbi:hypothetical protein FHEFKHOI_01505 [Candidatus Methanoperedenaceae archaeon GB50]|nr:hypothetical protein FHEFKHOI_01505 [Candidatus Methanoperedenaceae archaeon GB50]
MIEKQALDCPSSPTFQSNSAYKTAFSYLLNGNNHNINLLGETVTFKDLVEKGMPRAIKDSSIQLSLIKYLGRCHAAAHIEKEGQADKKQTVNDTRLSSPFGNETEVLVRLTDKLKALPFDKIVNREEFLPILKETFKNAPGDTERPINEVDLWSWSSIVAALYKSALAGALLGNKPEGPNELKWRLLAIRIDSDRILGDVAKIPVLLARKKWITEGLDNVKELIEEEYPLGNEVYRDENGSIFVVPDIPSLLELKENAKNSEKTLEDLISERLGFQGEIVVTPSLSEHWWGQKPPNNPHLRKDKIPPIGEILQEKPYSPPDPEKIKEWWKEAISRAQKESNPEICTISWLRPQGKKEGALRKSSDYWAKKVRGRSEEWYKDRSKTIWIDEVADKNGRICLITGKLDISGWLKPNGHVKTLLVKAPDGNSEKVVQKTPSFARLRRVWETTKTFWEEVEDDFEKTVGRVEKRLVITGSVDDLSKNKLSKNNVYEIDIEKTRVSVFYSGNGRFIVVENLERLARKMGYSKNDDDYLVYIQQELNDKEVRIYNPDGNNRNKHIGLIKTSKVEPIEDNFIPVIPIFSEPSLFMAIVPANKAMDIVKNINKKYEIEMDKVRNRLPLNIGLTFARSHTPIMALMESGWKMINASLKEEIRILNADSEKCDDKYILNFENGITWRVQGKMGDGITEDVWYPYFYVDGNPNDRNMVFKGPRGWLVHVSELKKGDAVKITPSSFDFEFLDSASRRFEISYDETGKRRDNTKSNRPYLIDKFDDFGRIWKEMTNNLAATQIKNVIGLIETKREEWNVSRDDETFKQFVNDVLRNANWKHGTPQNLDEITNIAVSGELKDIIELYMNILKAKGDYMNDTEVNT